MIREVTFGGEDVSRVVATLETAAHGVGRVEGAAETRDVFLHLFVISSASAPFPYFFGQQALSGWFSVDSLGGFWSCC
jgi:hypothetical protein